MATGSTTGVSGAWSMYRQCAATSGFHKSQLELFTKISLWLGITGAVIGTAAQFIAPTLTSMTSKMLGVVGSLAVALAGVAATQAIAGNRDQLWIKCRAVGEALKSAVYLYCASVPPFDDSNRASLLTQRVDKALKDLQGLELRPGKMDRPAPGPLTAASYIAARLDDQITFYTNAANKYQKKADFWRYSAFAGATLSATLGAVSAIFSFSPWVALLATVTTSITAFVKNQRYELLIGLYQATAMRLQLLKDQWVDSGKTDTDKTERDSFIQRCEETMSLENGAWMAQWSQLPAQRSQAEPGPVEPQAQAQPKQDTNAKAEVAG
jgi:hypothetical protein